MDLLFPEFAIEFIVSGQDWAGQAFGDRREGKGNMGIRGIIILFQGWAQCA